ncbi:MAG: hypothetical protein PVS2B3_05720 [Steroidobacteraceae bacterium]
MLRVVSIAALFVAGAVVTAQADVYRWLDEHGQPHYSDQWVPGSVVIKTARGHPPGYGNSARSADQRSLAAANERTDSQLSEQANAQAVQKDVAKARESQCKAMKARYIAAVQSRRVYKTGADGSREYLADDQADTYRTQIRKDVQDACGSVPEVNFDAPAPPPTPVPQSENP